MLDAALTLDQAVDLLAGMTWKESVASAVRRLAGKTPGGAFTRQQLIDAELGQITSEVGSLGLTPEQTLSRVLQELRPAPQSPLDVGFTFATLLAVNFCSFRFSAGRFGEYFFRHASLR